MRRLATLAIWLACVCVAACGGGDGDDSPSEPKPQGTATGGSGMPDPLAMPDAGPMIIHLPPGSTPVRTGDAGAPQPADNDFAVATPTGPRSSARIRGLVLDDQLKPIPGAGASAGGVVVEAGQRGYFVLDEVYGKDYADVLVRQLHYTEARVRVPIREDEISQVVVVLTPVFPIKVPDLALGGSFDVVDPFADPEAPKPDTPPMVVTLAAAGLQTGWGAAAHGAGTLSAIVFDRIGQMAAVPGAGMRGRTAAGEQVRLRGRAVFEVRVVQGGNTFELIKPANVAVPLWSDDMAVLLDEAADTGEDHLYWFDPEQAEFIERGSIAEDADSFAHGDIDRFGFWTIARPSTRLDCAHGTIVADANTAELVPFASLRAFEVTRFDSWSLFSDENGEFCGDTQPHGTLEVIGLGYSATYGLVRLQPFALSVSRPPDADVAALCAAGASGCVELGALPAATVGLGCVRGSLTGGNADGAGSWLEDAEDTGGSIPAQHAFCVEAPIGSTVTFTSENGNGTCGSAVTVAQQTGLCGEDGCTDLGAIKCCDTTDGCGDGFDADCDGEVDEGCTCGSTVCEQTAASYCCTPEQRCGARPEVSGKCVERDQAGNLSEACPNEVGTDDIGLNGCCRMDGRCGFSDYVFGCVPREDAADVFAVAGSFAPLTCTP